MPRAIRFGAQRIRPISFVADELASRCPLGVGANGYSPLRFGLIEQVG